MTSVDARTGCRQLGLLRNENVTCIVRFDDKVGCSVCIYWSFVRLAQESLPVTISDVASFCTSRRARLYYDILRSYGKNMDEHKWLTRMIFLESVAGVPVRYIYSPVEEMRNTLLIAA
jgi:hypothetical protein